MIGIYNLRNIYNESFRFFFGFSDWCWSLLEVFHRGSSQVDSLVSVLKKKITVVLGAPVPFPGAWQAPLHAAFPGAGQALLPLE
jgi:hypothetical protein